MYWRRKQLAPPAPVVKLEEGNQLTWRKSLKDPVKQGQLARSEAKTDAPLTS